MKDKSKKIKRWWEDASQYYQKKFNIPIGIHYGPGAPLEDELKLLGNINKKNILEIGCGGAQCGIAMAKKGAKVIGIDISEEELKFAKDLVNKNKVNIKLIQGSILNLKVIKSNSQDIVFSAYSLQYIGNLKKCFKEVYRVLKVNGIFTFSLEHPFFYTLDHKGEKIKQSYFDAGEIVEDDFWPDGSKHTFVGYSHKIQDLFDALVQAGFFVERIIEPDSRKKCKGDSWIGVGDSYGRKRMSIFPATIIFKSIKK
ncbi:MAG: class I SAM-dependent methyltransferase [Candidatus Pacearchaeota archaeon]|nr:class I SAM-dependent methyltransferase [Candidatus Pacearchaeota archaeon]